MDSKCPLVDAWVRFYKDSVESTDIKGNQLVKFPVLSSYDSVVSYSMPSMGLMLYCRVVQYSEAAKTKKKKYKLSWSHEVRLCRIVFKENTWLHLN